MSDSSNDPGASMRSDVECIHARGDHAVVATVAGTIRGEVSKIHQGGFTVAGWVGVEWRAIKSLDSEPAPWRKCLGESWTEIGLSDTHNRAAIRFEFHAKSAPMDTVTAREMAAALVAFADHIDKEF